MDPEVIGRIAERKIQEAIEEGKFDNLPGKGKPIVFDEDPLTPPHLRMMNRILKNANVLPEWVQVQKDIQTERTEATTLRARLVREHQKQFARVSVLPPDHKQVTQFITWHTTSRETYHRRLKSVNTAILKLSLIAPTSVQPPAPFRIDQEMAAFDAEFPALPHPAPSPAIPGNTSASDRSLKAIARERYQTGGGEVLGWSKTARMLHKESEAGSQIGPVDSEDIRHSDVPDERQQR